MSKCKMCKAEVIDRGELISELQKEIGSRSVLREERTKEEIAFEKECLKTKSRDQKVWTPDYHKGFIDGQKQSLALLKEVV